MVRYIDYGMEVLLFQQEAVDNKTNINTDDTNFTLIGASANTVGLWFVATGMIDFTKADLTQGNNVSSINTIGNNIIESLTVHNDRADAISAGVPLYSAYLKTSGVAYPTTAGWVRDIVLPA